MNSNDYDFLHNGVSPVKVSVEHNKTSNFVFAIIEGVRVLCGYFVKNNYNFYCYKMLENGTYVFIGIRPLSEADTVATDIASFYLDEKDYYDKIEKKYSNN